MSPSEFNLSLSQASEFVADRMGLHFPQERWRDLERGIRSAAREFGFADLDSCLGSLLSSSLTRNQIEILASHLTIGETYFFRDKKSFEILEAQILPELIRSRRLEEARLRIWSAGCCTGEEPYSLAILLSQMIPDLSHWNIMILATDINPKFLRKAEEGVYGEWSFRDVPPRIRERFFTRETKSKFEVLPQIKEMVTFSYLNLAEDCFPSLADNTNAMDLILCRNVLMYFNPERAKKAVRQFHRSLVNNGWLMVSPTEASVELAPEFARINFPGALLYRKGGQALPGKSTFPCSMHSADTFSPQLLPAAPSTQPGGATGLEGLTSPAQEESPEKSAPHAPYEEALAHYEQGRYANAAERLEKWLIENQSDAQAMVLLARAYANQGKLSDALAWCENAIAADKIDSACHFLRAAILLERGQLEAARATLKRVLYLDPKFVLAHFSLGSLARRLGNCAEAERHFRNASTLLREFRPEEVLPESDGMTAARLAEVIRFTASGARAG